MIAAYNTYQFFTCHTIAHNKPRPETHSSTAQVQNVNISISNQNAYTPANFPNLPVRNIPDTYSCVINKLSPAINVKVPAATARIPAAIKQIHATIT
ncbi:hypothetical protein DSO57_1034189 [Entomophthora muscae]|uniref:Uncharacterized protein n=1 Tax=Entomophthora muscae TaxID=34485 RepID=A0ACC2SP97_9FUNG|nr:hypothetical protein DSO57_1034189 [Entomophthora muscae]